MQYDIRDLPVYIITARERKEHQRRIDSLVGRLGLCNVNKVYGKYYAREGKSKADIKKFKCRFSAAAHIHALSRPGIMVILEDDAQETKYYNPIIDLPDGPDIAAFYLGTSIVGYISKERYAVKGEAKYLRVDEQFTKPLNVLGMHAIFYLSEAYKQVTIEILRNYEQQNFLCFDIAIAAQMANHNIYSYCQPWFYQNQPYADRDTLGKLDIITDLKDTSHR